MSPMAAPRACPRPGCRHAQPCPDHAPQRWSYGTPGRQMPPGWDATRLRIMERDRWTCRTCGEPAAVVDHDQPGIEADWNLKALCQPCSDRKTQREAQAARGIPERTQP